MGVNYLKGVKDAMNNFDRNQVILGQGAGGLGLSFPKIVHIAEHQCCLETNWSPETIYLGLDKARGPA